MTQPDDLTKEFELLFFETCRNLMSSLELEDVLNGLLAHALKLLAVDRACIILLSNIEASRAAHGDGVISLIKIDNLHGFKNGKGLSAKAYQTAQLVATEDYVNDPAFEQDPNMTEWVVSNSIRAALSVPILVNGQVVALLEADKTIVYHWNKIDLELAQKLAQLAALSIHNAQLYGRLAERNRELEVLENFHQRMRGPLSLKEAATRALMLAMETAQADSGVLYWRYENSFDELTFVVGLCEKENLPPWNPRIKMGQGFSGRVAQSGQSVLVEDLSLLLEHDPKVTTDPNPLWRSAIFVPLSIYNEVVGIVCLCSLEPKQFSPDQVRFLEMMAGQIALTVQQNSLLEMQRERDQLAAVLTMARTAAHELNQHLTILQVELDLLNISYASPSVEVIESMREAVEQMTQRVRQYQKIVRFETIEPVPGISVIDFKKSVQKPDPG